MKRASSGVSCFRIISGKDPSMKKPIYTNRRTSVAKGAKVANMVTAAPDSRRGCRAQVAPQRMPLVRLDRQQVVARHRPDQAEAARRVRALPDVGTEQPVEHDPHASVV